MIVQCCYLEKYDWLLKVFYEVDEVNAMQVLIELDQIDCDPIAFHQVADLLNSGQKNVGFTYTDESQHITFVVISETTDAAEFQNTYDHEKGHAAVHIAKALGFDLLGEEYQYLQGEIGQQTFKAAKRFLCDRCREDRKFRNQIVKGWVE